ncbi:hypothetical protein [Fictibacillus barbaricus]|uniref:Lipoprotein n=1 Tax=Fictibacillus barbaricus TaxID=182136 RepID=A0ABS2ZHW3_9BACL|nr:hypothetical protein [Fictibacillus barbaricus]MBN3546992.1 hypothetical protein [Fictibacillus barbaricus]GGB45555.1 hypothetical protein GCM10007199_08650 [Fictibacillus barbaricus]
MKKLMSVCIVLFLMTVFTSCSSLSNKEEDVQYNKKDAQHEKAHSSEQSNEVSTMIANDEKIIKMLKEKGEIPEDATQEEISQALQKYLQNKNPVNLQDEKAKNKYLKEIKEKIQNENKKTE